jgi:hypothetical protein
MSTAPITLELTIPVKDGNDDVTVLSFRRPTAADFEAMDSAKGSHSGMIALIARVCNLPVKTVRSLDGFDYVKASEVVSDFLPSAHQTGVTSSET